MCFGYVINSYSRQKQMFFLLSFNTLLDDDPAAKELEYAINSRHRWVNPLCGNPTKWSNTLKQFVSYWRRIVWVCLTIF